MKDENGAGAPGSDKLFADSGSGVAVDVYPEGFAREGGSDWVRFARGIGVLGVGSEDFWVRFAKFILFFRFQDDRCGGNAMRTSRPRRE